MRCARLVLCLVALVAFKLSVMAFEKRPVIVQDLPEFTHAQFVAEGLVVRVDFLTEDGKVIAPKSSDDKTPMDGPRFQVDLKVAEVLKYPGMPKDPKNTKPGKDAKAVKKSPIQKDDVLHIEGRTADKDKKKHVVPRKEDAVVAFLKRAGKDRYQALEPKGFLIRSVGRGPAAPVGPSPGPEAGKKSD